MKPLYLDSACCLLTLVLPELVVTVYESET